MTGWIIALVLYNALAVVLGVLVKHYESQARHYKAMVDKTIAELSTTQSAHDREVSALERKITEQEGPPTW